MVFIKLPLLVKFRHLTLTMPQELPKRSVTLRQTYNAYEQKLETELQNEKSIDVPLGPIVDGVPVRRFDINNEDHFKEMTLFVQRTTDGLLSDDPYDRILMSKKISCCGKSLKTVLPGTTARLYTTTGTKSCLVLKSSCTKCGREFWPGYEQLKNGNEFNRVYNDDENKEFFCSTRESVFEIKYLKQVTATSEAGGLPFVDHADIYNISQQINEDWRRMDRRQLLVAFLLWNISWRLPGVPLKCRMTKRREFDSEFFCVNAYPVLRAKYKTWTKHKCQNKGCILRGFVIDGNEKLYRRICSAPKERVICSNKKFPNYYRMCINSPKFGAEGYSKSKGTTLCELHLQTNDAKEKNKGSVAQDNVEKKKVKVSANHEETVEIVDLNKINVEAKSVKDEHKPRCTSKYDDCTCSSKTKGKAKHARTKTQLDMNSETKQLAKNIEPCGENVAGGVGCRGEEKVNKYTCRTAGVIGIVRTCLIRLSLQEMFTAESLASLALAIIDQFGTNPDPEDVKFCVLDRVCDLHPYIKKKANLGNEVFKRYLILLEYVLDTFHAEKHVKPVCVKDNPECIYHPKCEKFKHLKDVNFEAAEKSWVEYNKHKTVTRLMTYGHRLCYFLIIDDEHNKKLENRFNMKKQLIDSGAPAWWDGKPDPKIRPTFKLKGNKKKRDDDDDSKKNQDDKQDDVENQPKKMKRSINEPRSSNMRGSEKPTTDAGTNRCRMCMQLMDCEDTLIYTGHPNDAMDENVGLSNAKHKVEISNKQLSVRLNDCAIYDGNQHIIPYSNNSFFINFFNSLIDKKNDLFLSGFVEKYIGSEIQEGVPIYDCGPIIRCWSDTYVGCDRPYLVFKTPLAEYYAINSSPMYAPLMNK